LRTTTIGVAAAIAAVVAIADIAPTVGTTAITVELAVGE
jgi:hypothetical protein